MPLSKKIVQPKILSTTTYADHIEVIEEWRTGDEVFIVDSPLGEVKRFILALNETIKQRGGQWL